MPLRSKKQEREETAMRNKILLSAEIILDLLTIILLIRSLKERRGEADLLGVCFIGPEDEI